MLVKGTLGCNFRQMDWWTRECLRMNSSIGLMVMNHDAKAQTMYTIAFRYFRTQIKENESTFTALKYAPGAFLCRTKFILRFRNPASHQSRETVEIFLGYPTYSRGALELESPTTITYLDIQSCSFTVASDLKISLNGVTVMWCACRRNSLRYGHPHCHWRLIVSASIRTDRLRIAGTSRSIPCEWVPLSVWSCGNF